MTLADQPPVSSGAIGFYIGRAAGRIRTSSSSYVVRNRERLPASWQAELLQRSPTTVESGRYANAGGTPMRRPYANAGRRPVRQPPAALRSGGSALELCFDLVDHPAGLDLVQVVRRGDLAAVLLACTLQ